MQIYNIYREKLLNAILYFAKNTDKATKLKIFKLLFFLDFDHFKETGRSVTNLEYYAFPNGPIPREFWVELEEAKGPPEDFKSFMNIIGFESEFSSKKGNIFLAKKEPDLTVFSPREKGIMEKLSYIYKEADAEAMTDCSHLPNAPWDQTIKKCGPKAHIDYLLVLDKDAKVSKEQALEIMRERKEMLEAFPPAPRLVK